MPSHNAKSLFDLNMISADELLKLYDGINGLGVKLDISWLLRATIVFAISAFDSYFHDKIKYRAGHYDLKTLPPALSRFCVPISGLVDWEKSKRKGNVIRNWVTDYYSVRPLQHPEDIANALKIVGIENFWPTIEPNNDKKKALLAQLREFTIRRNQVAHEGDREGARNSGKKLRSISRQNAQNCVDFIKNLVTRIEAAFPS